MNYSRWNDDELRRVLGANPKDIDAVMEAARRFEAGATDSEIEERDNEIGTLQERVKDLESEVERLDTECRVHYDDAEAERERVSEARAENNELRDRIAELEASGAGLV